MSVGALGEATAVAYLERKGYRIVDTNVRFGPSVGLKGELDIVAWDEAVLVFIEVKTRRGIAGRVSPAENVTPAKQRQIIQLALAYGARHTLDMDEETAFRFDVVAVTLTHHEPPQVARVQHFVGAFLAEDAG